MKILAFSDNHLNEHSIKEIKKKAKKADILICAGDLSWFGSGLKDILKDLNKIKKPLYIIPGNHEEWGGDLRKVCKNYKNITFVHKTWRNIEGFKVFFWGGGGFADRNKELEEKMIKFKNFLKKGDQVIFVTHGPPYNTKLDFLEWAGHVGCKSQRKFDRSIKPILHICGHLHEHMYEKEVLFKKTLIVNPGPEGTILKV